MSTNHRAPDRRITVIQAVIVVWMMAIGAKLLWLQVKQHDWLFARASRQQQAEIDLSPMRGVIYDRNGNELARSVAVKSLYASPAEMVNPGAAADTLSELLDIDRDDLYRRLTSGRAAVAVKRKLDDKEVAGVDKLGLTGLRYINEMKRFYVSGASAAHLLGFVDIDERGVGGVELSYDKLIRGQGGRLLLDVDALNKSYDHSVEDPVPGANISLTIDLIIQNHVEKALAQAVRATRARGGTIVILRPATGEILALANYPTFDPNKVSESNEIQRRNRAVETAFEPGSIFKLVTYAAALDEHIIRANTPIDCGGGQIKIADRIVHDHPYGVLTAAQALAKSSNVAAIKIGMRLGNERLASYIERFGFGKRTGIELPGESRGLFQPPSEWGPTTIGSIPMGHEIGVTAVQAAAAYACIANGGEWVKPHLVERVTSTSGDVLDEARAERRQVVSEATAVTLKSMLEGVVLQGTGKAARMGGYSAAGKTGTAQKIDEATGRYSQTRYVASFAGFAPVENPEVACVVSLDEPVGAHLGGAVAAPVFARVVSDALHTLGVRPENDPQSLLAEDFQVYDTAEIVAESQPSAPTQEDDSRPALDVSEAASHDPASKRYGSVVMPDLMGKGIREAVGLCAAQGLKLKAAGDGVVSLQNPSPGALVAQDTICRVKLSKAVAKKTAIETTSKPTSSRVGARAN
ncbi:MAG TPA: penicillin-binding protein [Blastocatellia bacterium]|nr:penicillin-binding protein [Blastocatellia bacterium]